MKLAERFRLTAEAKENVKIEEEWCAILKLIGDESEKGYTCATYPSVIHARNIKRLKEEGFFVEDPDMNLRGYGIFLSTTINWSN